MTVADMSRQVKAKLLADSIAAIDDPKVLIIRGHPGKVQPPDIVAWTRVTTAQVPGPVSTNRARDITITAAVMVSVSRRGGREKEQVAEDRAWDLLVAIEEYVRVTDPTLGGLVRWCFCTAAVSDGSTDPQVLAKGRVIEIEAEFTAVGRITN